MTKLFVNFPTATLSMLGIWRTWLPWILALFLTTHCLLAEESQWKRFTFSGEPWDKYPRGSYVANSLLSLAQDPLGPGYLLAMPSRRQALENIDDAGHLDELRRDVTALLQADPENIAAAFILAELDEFQRKDAFHSPSVQIGFPAWLKLERKGSEVVASISKDGQGWRELSRQVMHLDKFHAGILAQSRAVIDSVDLQFPGAKKENWKCVSIGEAGGPSRFTDEAGVWTVEGRPGSRAVDGAFVGQTVEGDGTFVARIVSAANTGKAGLLFIDSPESRDLSLLETIQPDGNVAVRAEGMTVRSAASLEYLKKLLPGNEAVTVRLARALFHSRQYDRAIELLLPLLKADPGPVFSLDFDALSKLITRKGQLDKVAAALLEWEAREGLSPISMVRAGPFLLVAQYLRDRGDQNQAIAVLERGMDQLGYEDDLYLLPVYLQYLDESGRLKEGEPRFLRSLLEKDAKREGARRTGYVLGTLLTDPVSREEIPRILLILRYAAKMGALDKLIENNLQLMNYAFSDVIILSFAIAMREDEKYLALFDELVMRIETETLQPDDAQLISCAGDLLYHAWPEAKEYAFKFLEVPPISAGGIEGQIKILHRLADAARLEENWEVARKAVEDAAQIRMTARENGYGNIYTKQVPPIEFKTAQLLHIVGSEIDPHLLLRPYADLPGTVPNAERTLTLARVNQVLTRLDGRPIEPKIVAFPVPGPAESKLGIEMAPGPLKGAHSNLTVGQPVRLKEFDKAFDWRIWSGPAPDKLELGETIESAPAYVAREWTPGLSYFKLGFRPHGSKEPFQDTETVHAVGIGRNLSPDPVQSGIQPGKSAIEKPTVKGWTDVPPGILTKGDPGPIPETPTLRFISRHSEDTVHLEMNRIPVRPGKRYYQSIWLRSPPRPGTANLGMRFLDANGKQLGISRCPEDYDDPRWLLASQVLTTRAPGRWEVSIPEGTAFLQPVLSIWYEADWCGHFVCEVE